MSFTEAEHRYLDSQVIGRLATLAPDGTVQNNPVSFRCNSELGTIDIGGYHMGATKKFRNIDGGNVQVAFVVDELLSVERQEARGIEIRGRAETLRDQEPYLEGFTGDLIRIHPQTVFSWAIDQENTGMRKRTITA